MRSDGRVNPEPDCLFVYGTPKQGYYNFDVVKRLVSRALAGWSVQGTLYDTGPYPALSLDGEGPVEGELLESRDLAELLRVTDDIEGDEYVRVAVIARSPDGASRAAWTYRYAWDVSKLKLLAGGRWPEP